MYKNLFVLVLALAAVMAAPPKPKEDLDTAQQFLYSGLGYGYNTYNTYPSVYSAGYAPVYSGVASPLAYSSSYAYSSPYTYASPYAYNGYNYVYGK